MAIRVFLNQWTEVPLGDGRVYIKDPIDEYLTNVSLSDPLTFMQNFHGSFGLTNRPDRVYLLKVIQGNLTDAEWATLAALPGVRAVPPGAFDKTISSINNPTKNKIYAVLDSLGIPRSVFDSAPTVGSFLRNVLTELNGGAVSFGPLELASAEWA